MNESINKKERVTEARRRRRETRIWCIVGLAFMIQITIILELLRLLSSLFTAIAIVLMLCCACFLFGRIWEAKKIYG